MGDVIRLGCLGSDSSHLVEFARRMNAMHAAGETRCRVTAFWSDGKHDMPADDVAKWEAGAIELGAQRVATRDALLDQVDGVLVLAVNGHKHFNLALPCLQRGLPTYIDKPLTCDLDEAIQLLQASRESNARCYSASSLRFAKEVTALPRETIGEIAAIEATGPGELNDAMEGLYFYGVHTIEIVDALFGKPGVARVRAMRLPQRDLVDLQYHDGRTAHLRLERNASYEFAATVHGSKSIHSFRVDFAGVYDRLVRGMATFFEGGPPPASLRDIVENIAVMSGGNRSLREQGQWVELPAIP